MAQTVDLVVDGGVFGDVGVGVGNVGFRLVVVVIRDEVFDGCFWEKFFEFGGQLRGQGFIVTDNDGRFLELFDNGGHGVRLARPRNTQQGLKPMALFDSIS